MSTKCLHKQLLWCLILVSMLSVGASEHAVAGRDLWDPGGEEGGGGWSGV